MEIRIIRSAKRLKTVQACKIGEILEILAPACMPDNQLGPIIKNLQARIDHRNKLSELDDQDFSLRRRNAPVRSRLCNRP